MFNHKTTDMEDYIISLLFGMCIYIQYGTIFGQMYCNTLQLLYTIDAEELCDLGYYINLPCYRPKKKQLPWLYILFNNYT